MKLADRIRQARAELGLTRQQLADAVGVSAVTVKGWECGTYEPKPKTYRALCGYLGLDLPDSVAHGDGAPAGTYSPRSCTDCPDLAPEGSGLNRRYRCTRSGAYIDRADIDRTHCFHAPIAAGVRYRIEAQWATNPNLDAPFVRGMTLREYMAHLRVTMSLHEISLHLEDAHGIHMTREQIGSATRTAYDARRESQQQYQRRRRNRRWLCATTKAAAQSR